MTATPFVIAAVVLLLARSSSAQSAGEGSRAATADERAKGTLSVGPEQVTVLDLPPPLGTGRQINVPRWLYDRYQHTTLAALYKDGADRSKYEPYLLAHQLWVAQRCMAGSEFPRCDSAPLSTAMCTMSVNACLKIPGMPVNQKRHAEWAEDEREQNPLRFLQGAIDIVTSVLPLPSIKL